LAVSVYCIDGRNARIIPFRPTWWADEGAADVVAIMFAVGGLVEFVVR
jgi:hypothetical protein